MPRGNTIRRCGLSGLSLTLWLCAASLVQAQTQVAITHDDTTWFKATTAQSSQLPADRKCLLTPGTVLEVSRIEEAGVHYAIELPRAYANCSLTQGYLYKPHASLDTLALTVQAPTVFKRQAVSSSTLADRDKCDLPPGIYGLSGAPRAEGTHYRVNFASVPDGCGFSSGYVWNGHATDGIVALTLHQATVFKTSTAQSSELPENERCDIAADSYLLTSAPEAQERHYRVTFTETPANCGFRSGFLWYQPTTLAEPAPKIAEFSWPQPGSDLGSRWCVCRSIGTSPHIGQDFVQWGAKRAVAVHEGTVSSIAYSNSCGYILRLTDQFGAVWRYVHLNNPQVRRGEWVSNGQMLASISNYPRAGCGTGPHLHFERRSAGLFNDAPVGRSCQSGWRSCYYNPLTPFESGFSVSTQGTAQMSAAQLSEQTEAPASACKIDPQEYAVAAAVAEQHASSERLLVNLGRTTMEPAGEAVLTGKVGLADNPDNRCDLNQGRDCIASWQVLAERSDGTQVRLFFDAAVRDTPLQRVAREAYCLPEAATGRLTVLARTAAGDALRAETFVSQ